MSEREEELLNLELPEENPPTSDLANELPLLNPSESPFLLNQTDTTPGEIPPVDAPSKAPVDTEKPAADSQTESLSNETETQQLAFDLYINGPLDDRERGKLVDLLAREDLGIREVDLQTQFEIGKIKIPRISEFGGVLIVQALRGSRARIQLLPTDQYPDEKEMNAAVITDVSPAPAVEAHPAESIPISTERPLAAAVIDVVVASAILESRTVETENSPEFQKLLDALQRELKYKAYRKGAQAVVGFSIQLSQLSMSTHYRVTATGTAVRNV